MLNVSEIRHPQSIREALTAENVTIHDIVEAMGSLSDALSRYETTADIQYLHASIAASRLGERLFSLLTMRLRASRRVDNKETHAARQRIDRQAQAEYLRGLHDQMKMHKTAAAQKRAVRISKMLLRAEAHAGLLQQSPETDAP